MKYIFNLILIFSLFMTQVVFSSEETKSEPVTTKSEPETTNSSRVPVSTGKYITGGVLGSALGFGIGHGVQGRYSQQGWIHTVGEVAGLSLLVNGIDNCVDGLFSKAGCKSDSTAQINLGLALFIGFRVWEVVDVWTGARPVDTESSFYILPLKDKTVLGFARSF